MAPRRGGTGFIGLNQYLGLNRGAADRMAGDVDAVVQGKAGDYLSSMRSAEEDFRSKLSSAALPTGDPLTSEEAEAGSAREWKGPSGFTSEQLQSLHGKAREAESAANATGTLSGLGTTLRDKYGGNTWGGGMMDAALTGAAGGDRFAASRGAFGRLTENLGTIQGRAMEQAAGAQNAFRAQQARYAGMVPGLKDKEAKEAAAAAAAEKEREAARIKAEREANKWNFRPHDEYPDTPTYGEHARDVAQEKSDRGQPELGTAPPGGRVVGKPRERGILETWGDLLVGSPKPYYRGRLP